MPRDALRASASSRIDDPQWMRGVWMRSFVARAFAVLALFFVTPGAQDLVKLVVDVACCDDADCEDCEDCPAGCCLRHPARFTSIDIAHGVPVQAIVTSGELPRAGAENVGRSQRGYASGYRTSTFRPPSA